MEVHRVRPSNEASVELCRTATAHSLVVNAFVQILSMKPPGRSRCQARRVTTGIGDNKLLALGKQQVCVVILTK